MRVIALDIGSSSVKAAVLNNGKAVGRCAKVNFPTEYAGVRAEVRPQEILSAVSKALSQLNASTADVLALCTMAPSWIAMDGKGKCLTNIITHQDRRSIEEAHELENRVGKDRHLQLAGNRPFPGGISSTTAAWFARHHPAVLQKAALVAHLNTFLLNRWTGARLTDPSNASFMGVYRTTTLSGWSEELVDAAGLRIEQLPDVIDAGEVAGLLSAAAAAELGLPEGMPVLPGIMDTSAAVFLLGAKNRTLFNVSGSTDVLALCVDEPRPHEQLLTRALGTGRKWMAVSTIASVGTTLSWLHETLFAEMSQRSFYSLVAQKFNVPASSVRFEPYLAGDRMSIDQKQGGFTGLSLSTSRESMLTAALDSLARHSAARIPLLQQVYGKISRDVAVGGGVGESIAAILHRDWTANWRFKVHSEATLRGLYALAERAISVSAKQKG